MAIHAFVGHSFLSNDRDVVGKFLDFFNHVSGAGLDFSWDHAEGAEPNELSIKVREKMEGKDLFIGICTSRQKSIDLDKLTSFPLSRNKLWGNQIDFVTKTSDWILQEIGFAYGRDMKIMILLESGVKTPGGIQGDIEYIPFERENPERSFNKILEMLRSLTVLPASKVAIESSKVEKTSQQATPISSNEVGEDKPMSEWAMDAYEDALFVSIVTEDAKEEEEINSNFMKSSYAITAEKLAKWKAYRLYLNIKWKKENRLDQLLALLRANPENIDVVYYVGQSYSVYDEHERAAFHFEKSALGAEKIEDKIVRLSLAALARAKNGEIDKVIQLNKKCISMVRELGHESPYLYASLADVANELGNTADYKAFTEALLEISPEEHYRRFSLAFKYSEDGEDNMALYHYQILSKRNPDSTNWNNLGVALNNLKLPALSVSAYRESEKLNGTLAMSNLAHKFIAEGFLDEAKKLTDKATSIPDYDHRIGGAIISISQTKEKEEKEQSKIIDLSRKIRQFYIDYSNAYVKEDLQSLPLNWQGEKCKFVVSLKQEDFEAIGMYEKASPWYDQKKEIVKEFIKYVGKVNGHCIKYEYWISENEPSIVKNIKPSGSGFMVVDDQLQRIGLHDFGSRDEKSFSEMTVINDDKPQSG